MRARLELKNRSLLSTEPNGRLADQLKELDMFFQGKDQVHKTLRRLVTCLKRAKISYAVLGGMALARHHYRRVTTDVDVLLTTDGLAEFRRLFLDKNYEQSPGRKRRFVDRKNGVTIDILVAGQFPGSGNPGPVSFPDPNEVGEEVDDVRYVDLVTMIQLKLAARRHRDFGDVVELIRFNELDESFAQKLHPSIRTDYIECLEEKWREDEYEARNG